IRVDADLCLSQNDIPYRSVRFHHQPKTPNPLPKPSYRSNKMQNPPIDGKFPRHYSLQPRSHLHPRTKHKNSKIGGSRQYRARSTKIQIILSSNSLQKTPNGKSKSETERTPELGGEVEEDELPVKYLVGFDARWPASRRRKLQRDFGNANLSGRLVPQLGNLTNLLYL
ncbi:hypothetical protein U1Q18_015021, partial [Sarracenia purpurea var. burkii]